MNLLTPRQTGRGINGDSAQMLRARRGFLGRGFYRPLRDRLVVISEEILGDRLTNPVLACGVLEAGCGDGYYIGGISDALAKSETTFFLGTDLSKHAAQLAARRYASVLFFVSDIHHRISVADASITLLLDVFAPRNPEEFARVLEPGGSALIVIPAPSHLFELRSELGLLDIEPDKEVRLLERFTPYFSVSDRAPVEFPMSLSAEDTALLVEMGPNHWHKHGELSADRIASQASFVILHLRRRSAD